MIDEAFIQQLNAAYAVLETAKWSVLANVQHEATGEYDFELARAEAQLGGKIKGNNPQERDASAVAALADERGALEEMKRNTRFAKCKAEVAALEVERLRAVLRASELIARTSEPEAMP